MANRSCLLLSQAIAVQYYRQAKRAENCKFLTIKYILPASIYHQATPDVP